MYQDGAPDLTTVLEFPHTEDGSHVKIFIPAMRGLCLSLSWIKWCLVQCWTHKGIDGWPRRVVRRDDAESELLSIVVCSEKDLEYIQRLPSPLLQRLNHPFCVWAKCDLSLESGFVNTQDLACILPFFTRTQKGVFVLPPPSPITEEGGWKRLFSFGAVLSE